MFADNDGERVWRWQVGKEGDEGERRNREGEEPRGREGQCAEGQTEDQGLRGRKGRRKREKKERKRGENQVNVHLELGRSPRHPYLLSPVKHRGTFHVRGVLLLRLELYYYSPNVPQ